MCLNTLIICDFTLYLEEEIIKLINKKVPNNMRKFKNKNKYLTIVSVKNVSTFSNWLVTCQMDKKLFFSC